MPRDLLLQPLLMLSDEGATAPVTDPPWPGPEHSAIKSSDAFSAFADAAAVESAQLSQLMGGATLNVTRELGSYSITSADGAWIVARLLSDGTRLAASRGRTARQDVHQALGQALDGLLVALSSGMCPTTDYLGLRGISLHETDAADVGVGVLRRLTGDEARAFATEEGDSWPARETSCVW